MRSNISACISTLLPFALFSVFTMCSIYDSGIFKEVWRSVRIFFAGLHCADGVNTFLATRSFFFLLVRLAKKCPDLQDKRGKICFSSYPLQGHRLAGRILKKYTRKKMPILSLTSCAELPEGLWVALHISFMLFFFRMSVTVLLLTFCLKPDSLPQLLASTVC